MTTITETHTAPDMVPPTHPSRRHLVTTISIGAAVAVAAVAAATFALTRDHANNSTTIATRDVAATQQIGQACQQWFDSRTDTTVSGYTGWCGYMRDWMSDHMRSGQMVGPMMWGTPAAMRDTCLQAAAGSQPAIDDPAQWCQRMVDWMTQHMGSWMGGNWDGWTGPMGPMMGR
jgi:hypothetical protein